MFPDALTRIKGPNLSLRLIQPDDAEYVFGLRTNPTYNTHLSKVQGSADDQGAWIATYKTREASGQEFYYIIERNDGIRCGTVRLYNIENKIFTWGSWILDHNKTKKAALESAVLSFGAGFDILKLSLANIDVRINNHRALSFYRRFGMTEISRSLADVFFSYSRSQFIEHRDDYMRALEGERRA